MSKTAYKITLLPGDGIGPEIVGQARKVLEAVGEAHDLHFELSTGLIGAVAIESSGDPLPEDTLELCRASDAILLGAVGDPRFDNDPAAKVRPEQGLLKIRKELGLFCNIRPVTAFPTLLHKAPLRPDRLEGADLVIYRELTSGIYFGEKGTAGPDEAYDECRYRRDEIERIAHLAFGAAQRRKGKLTLVDKANVLETSRLWRRVVQDMSSSYSEVEVDYQFVDNAAMQLILNPAQFDVVLTGNMFGDILSDEASVISGSLGLLPSASTGAQTALFEPCHGSWPQAAGKDIANPVATILSVAMMMDHLDQGAAGDAIRSSVSKALELGIGTEDVQPDHPMGTEAVGDYLAELIRARQTMKAK